MSTLLNLTAEIAALDNMLAAAESPDDAGVQEAIAKLLDLTSQRQDKVNAYCQLMRELELRAEARKAEAKRLADAAARCERMGKNLQERLLFAMRVADITKIETPLFTVSRVKNGGKAPMTVDEDAVPEEYCTLVQEAKINKDRIRAELEAGKELPFARIEERGERLSVK